MSETVKETVGCVGDLLRPGQSGQVGLSYSVSVRQVADKLGLDISTASRRVKKALAGGYLENLETGRGRPYKLRLGALIPDDVTILPTVADLHLPTLCQSDVQGSSSTEIGIDTDPCSVARETEGEAPDAS